MNEMENAISKVYEQIAQTGQVSKNQLLFIKMYEKKNSKQLNIMDELIKYGNKLSLIIDKIFPIEGGK